MILIHAPPPHLLLPQQGQAPSTGGPYPPLHKLAHDALTELRNWLAERKSITAYTILSPNSIEALAKVGGVCADES